MSDHTYTYAEAVGEPSPVERVLLALPEGERLPELLRQHDAGLLEPGELGYALPACWVWDDPDDTDPRWLRLWRDAAAADGRCEWGEPLPPGETFTAYRGQPHGAMLGYAWSLSPVTGAAFAVAPAIAGHGRHVLLRGTVARGAVLGYIEDAGEAEVIAHPSAITGITVVPWPEAVQHAHRAQLRHEGDYIAW